MPLPTVRNNETEEEFIQRCMSDDTMNEEYPDNEQRSAVCYSQWRRRNKSMDIMRKSINLELKAEKEGSFTARIATLNVVDKDGDMTSPGAFPENKEVLVSAYQHESWMGALPVGKAVIKESGEDVIAEGEFNLKTETGREHYEAVKFTGGLQEWSYGFKVLDYDEKTIEGQHVRILKKVEPYEISPVLLGAGMNTATLAIKATLYKCECIECGYKLETEQHCDKIKCPECGGEMRRVERPGPGKSINPEKTTYSDQAETVLAAVDDLVVRTKSLADLRLKEGRTLSTENRNRIQKLLNALSEVAADLKELLEATEPKDNKAEVQRLFLEFSRIKNQLTEVC